VGYDLDENANGIPDTLDGSKYVLYATTEQGATITPSGDIIKDANGSQTFTIDVNEGYYAEVVIDGVSQGSSVGSYEFNDVNAHHAIEVIAGKVHNVTQDTVHKTIKAGIDAATNGDEVEVAEGTYYEEVDFEGKAITLRSTNPNDWDVVTATIIDANGLAQPGVKFVSGEDANSVLSGFTIQNSNSSSSGGIQCGGGSAEDGDPIISNCVIANNKRGIHCERSSPTIKNNIISANIDVGIHCIKSKTPVIENNWIYGTVCDDPCSGGGGIGVDIATGIATIRNNTVVGNLWGIWNWQSTDPNIFNCIVRHNRYDDLWRDTGTLGARYSCIEDSFEANDPNYEGSINADPCFVDAGYWDVNGFWVEGDYRLLGGSPCIDAGNPNYIAEPNETDLDGKARVIDGDDDGTAIVDIGAYEFDPNYVDPGSALVYVDSDIPVVGTVSGNFNDTYASADVYESITEVESGGQAANRRYSYLEHRWTAEVPSVNTATFHVEAYHTVNNEGDDFIFAYSKDDSIYVDMVTVTKSIDDDIAQAYEMPNDISGTVYIRVKDTDQTKGNNSLDAIYIDQMYILCTGVGEPTYGVTITESDGSTDVDEQGPTSDTYTVVLDSQPSDTVSITVDPDIETEVNGNGAGNPIQLFFLTTNWDAAQTVTVTAIDDSDVEGPHTSTISHISTSSDPNYNGIGINDLVANVADNDDGCNTSTLHVGSIVCESIGSKAIRYGQVTVSIYDNCGGHVADADVTGTFSGDFNETLTGTTDTSGAAVITTTTAQTQRPSYEFCVDDVSHGVLVYDPNNNVETCDSY
jgi:parallel beta-helix repeat protein